MKIKNETDAKQVWERIEKKYTGLGPETSTKLRDAYSKKIDPKDLPENFEEKLSKLSTENFESIEHIKRRWKNLRNQDTLVSVRSKGNYPNDNDQEPKGNYPDGLHHLVNKQKIKRSLNRKKLSSLLQAIRSGNWDDMIFEDKTIPQLAMSLYAASQITQQQIYSILEHHQVKKELTINKTYPILDENNQFTPEAMKYLNNIFKNRRYLKPLSDEQIEEFRLLISTLPSSERVLYTTDLGSVAKFSLGNQLVKVDSVYMHDDELIHLTSGARDALGIARFGENEYVRPMLRLGQQTVHDIEHGVKKQARYTAISYPETKAYSDGLHNWQNVTPFEATSHDFYHMNVMSSIPKNLLCGLWRFIDLTREQTKINMSAEIWDWIDADYNFTFHKNARLKSPNINDNTETTELFCNILLHKLRKKDRQAGALVQRNNTFFYHDQWSPTILGIIFYLDLIKNQDKWLEMGIDPNALTSPFKEHLAAIRAIYPEIKNNSFKIQLVKCLMQLQMKHKLTQNMLQTIDARAGEIEEKISIKKIKKADATDKNPANTIQFTYDNAEISCAKIYNDLKHFHQQKKANNSKKPDNEKERFKHAFDEWSKENPYTFTLSSCL